MSLYTTVHKDDKTQLLLGIEVSQDGVLNSFSPLDIAYTLAQDCTAAVVGANVYLNTNFPFNCNTLQMTGNTPDITKELEYANADFYFDAGGAFQYKGETTLNPDRAASAFVELFKAGKAILGPAYAAFDVTASHIHIEEHFGNKKTFFIYGAEP